MPLRTARAGDCRGTDADGSLSDRWCSLCYRNGAFVDPGCTVQRMVDTVDTALREQGSGRLMRWLARRQVPRLARWRTT